MTQHLKTVETPIHLIKINGYVSYMNPKQYVQEASYNSLTNRYYVTRQPKLDGLSISAKRCTKLASGVIFLPQ